MIEFKGQDITMTSKIVYISNDNNAKKMLKHLLASERDSIRGWRPFN